MADELPYWQQRNMRKLGLLPPAGKKSATQAIQEKAKKERKQTLSAWYSTQLSQVPKNCENCGSKLQQSMVINPRTVVCHIVAKTNQGGCPSVATHPLNRFFGCDECHNTFDKGGIKASQMPVIPICKSRLSKFIDQIPEEERRHIPTYLLP